MGSIIDLLALLDGWDYRVLNGTITVQPGVINEVFAENVKGWLIFAAYEATDAFANITVNMPPESFSIITTNLAQIAYYGLAPTPRTDPLAIATAFLVTDFDFSGLPLDSSGFGAALMNIVYPLALKKESVIHISFTLDPGTTQVAAVVAYEIIFIQIYRMDLFQKSLKDLLNVKKLPVL
jgi:hypothetical protein